MPSPETVLAETMALRVALLNMVSTLLRGEGMTVEQIQKLVERADGDKYRRVTDIVGEQAARKRAAAGNGQRQW